MGSLSPLAAHGSSLRAFWALVIFSFSRHFRVRQMAVVAFGLLFVLTGMVASIQTSETGWRLEKRKYKVAKYGEKDATVEMNVLQYSAERLPIYESVPGPPESFAIRMAVSSAFRSMITDTNYLNDYAFLRFARWTVITLYLGFLLPLFTLAYATGSLGVERESRTLIWLTTRPLPRWAIYLAKFLAVLPWCFLVSFVAFASLCIAGGELGRKAISCYWQPVVAGTLAYTAVFQFVGAVFRRPAVVGLVYVFFYETLVVNLPGSLKHLSLSYYVRSLFYNNTTEVVASVQPENLSVFAPADSTTAWLTLLLTTLAITGLGMLLFGRQEPQEET